MNKIEKRNERKNDITKLTFEGSIQTPVAYYVFEEGYKLEYSSITLP